MTSLVHSTQTPPTAAEHPFAVVERLATIRQRAQRVRLGFLNIAPHWRAARQRVRNMAYSRIDACSVYTASRSFLVANTDQRAIPTCFLQRRHAPPSMRTPTTLPTEKVGKTR